MCYRATGNYHKYVKFKFPNNHKVCGLLEWRSEEQVVKDFCNTLKQPWMWTPNTKKVWIDSGPIEYEFHSTAEYTLVGFEDLPQDFFKFPEKEQFLSYIRGSEEQIFVACQLFSENCLGWIPINVFTQLLHTNDVCIILDKLGGKTFSIKSPIFVNIPFSDLYDVISTEYRKQFAKEGSITIY